MIINGYIATTYCKEITFFSRLLELRTANVGFRQVKTQRDGEVAERGLQREGGLRRLRCVRYQIGRAKTQSCATTPTLQSPSTTEELADGLVGGGERSHDSSGQYHVGRGG